MNFSLETKTASLSVGEFAGFSLGPREAGNGGTRGIWRAQLGQHWHNELRGRTEKEFTVGGALRPEVQFEAVIAGRLVHRGWTFALNGRIDQLLPLDGRAGSPDPALSPGGVSDPVLQKMPGALLREIKSVMQALPAGEADLRAAYPEYFLQLAAYAVLRRALGAKATRAELIFVEAGSGLAQTIALTPFDEALVFHQLDALVEFLNLRQRATARRRALQFAPAFPSLRPGQETIQGDLAVGLGLSTLNPFAAVSPDENRGQTPGRQQPARAQPSALLFEAPTGYGKTGCVLEFALTQLRAGRFARLIWLTGKSTGQLQVVHTLERMTATVDRSGRRPCLSRADSPQAGTPATTPDQTAPATSSLIDYKVPLAFWQVRNKSEHCINHTFHCVSDGCDYLKDCAERWPQSGLAKFYLDDAQPHDLPTVREAGRQARICPYEITRTALAFNDVWIGDFNYVFAPDNRGLFFERPGFDPAETLLIVDEAHNLPSRTAGAHSHRATAGEAQLLLAELDHVQAPPALIFAVEEWARLLTSLRPAESLDPTLEAEIDELVAKLAEMVTTQPLDYVALGPLHSASLWQFPALAEFLANEQLTKLLWVSREGELEFTCVDAAPVIGEMLRQFGGAILMSATLQPYPEFAESCGLKVEPVLRTGSARPEDGLHPYSTLHAPTPWRAGAYDVAVDLRVDTTYRQRANHYGTTAETIEAIHAAARGPVAVFFPSYAYAESIQRALEHNGSVLRVAMQPRLSDLAAQTAWVEESLALSDALFLVLGSSFAEGIDLLGGRVTHAMVIGPALPEVNAVQKKRLDALATLGREAAFRRVYQIPGLQKVNQALGRLVRAPGQEARVLLHCRRFAESSYASLLAADYQMFREIASGSDLHDWLGRQN
ncbi:MAG: ATP-dependent helicase DinG [Lacunisphaera sp.]|nr:ATP-dependent helicase DinG [Lacunisphaera sp.]